MWLLISAFIVGFSVGLLHPVCDCGGTSLFGGATLSGLIFTFAALAARFVYGLCTFTFRDREHPWIVGNNENWNSKYK